MADAANPTYELIQLLSALEVGVESHDTLLRISPTFLRTRLQRYLSFAQPQVVATGQTKVVLPSAIAGDLAKVDFTMFEMGPIHGAPQAHSHSHDDGTECHGDHGPAHGHGHDHGADENHDHGHSHSAGGHSHESEDEEEEDEEEEDHDHHGHSHGGEPCDGDHGAPADHHGHSHGGEPCDGDHGGDVDDVNQVLRAMKYYLSMLVQGIRTQWARPPMFPGAPKRTIWVLQEDGKPSNDENPGHNLVLTVAGAANITINHEGIPATTPVVLLHYSSDTGKARKSLFGDTMHLNMPREILHILEVILEANSAKCPPFTPPKDVLVGGSTMGFKASFLAPLSDVTPSVEVIGDLDMTGDVIEKFVECGVCAMLGPELKCARCRGKAYCSALCQRKDWKDHKIVCGK